MLVVGLLRWAAVIALGQVFTFDEFDAETSLLVCVIQRAYKVAEPDSFVSQFLRRGQENLNGSNVCHSLLFGVKLQGNYFANIHIIFDMS